MNCQELPTAKPTRDIYGAPGGQRSSQRDLFDSLRRHRCKKDLCKGNHQPGLGI